MPGKRGTIVIDPGHGGNVEVGGSSHNNARTPSGVLEKNMTLRMAFLVRDALRQAATIGGHTINVILTRETDVNLGLVQRARVARDNRASLFLCIHFNASKLHNARGVETFLDRRNRNTNRPADLAYAQLVQTAVFNAVRAHDARTRDRRVKDHPDGLGVLNDASLGPNVRACLCEIEFIDRTDVDELLNLGPNAPQVRSDIATAIANALIAAL